MNHRDIAALMAGIAPVVRDYVRDNVTKALDGLTARVVTLENAREAPRAEIDPTLITQMIAEAVAKIPPASPGKDADPEIVKQLVAAEVDRAVASLPKPENGKDADPAAITLMVAEAVAKIPPASPGKDADPEIVKQLVAAEVDRAVAALPEPKDGNSITVDDVRPMLEEIVNRAVDVLPKIKDGVGLAGAVINRHGGLVLTLTDGTTKELGTVVGRDADPDEITRLIGEAVGKLPPPKDGKDGLGFDDFSVTYDGERAFDFRFARGDQVKEFPFILNHILDRGVWREGDFKKGDGVTFGGSFFIAQCDTTAKPETNADWRLAVKRGRDGSGAYDVARRAGFKGSEQDWLVSLKGEPLKPSKPDARRG